MHPKEKYTFLFGISLAAIAVVGIFDFERVGTAVGWIGRQLKGAAESWIVDVLRRDCRGVTQYLGSRMPDLASISWPVLFSCSVSSGVKTEDLCLEARAAPAAAPPRGRIG